MAASDKYLDPRELKLIRVGHFLWKRYKQNRKELGIEQALENVWALKRELRAELAVERAERNEKTRQRMAEWKSRQEEGVLAIV